MHIELELCIYTFCWDFSSLCSREKGKNCEKKISFSGISPSTVVVVDNVVVVVAVVIIQITIILATMSLAGYQMVIP